MYVSVIIIFDVHVVNCWIKQMKNSHYCKGITDFDFRMLMSNDMHITSSSDGL